MANLLADLAAALADGGIETVPEGWYTAREMAASAGKNLSWAQKLIQRGIAEGLVESKPFRIRNAGRVSAIPHYRVVS
jgi:hypothetical protein